MMKPDPKAARKDAKSIIERSGMRLRHRNLATCYLELERLARAAMWNDENGLAHTALRDFLGGRS